MKALTEAWKPDWYVQKVWGDCFIFPAKIISLWIFLKSIHFNKKKHRSVKSILNRDKTKFFEVKWLHCVNQSLTTLVFFSSLHSLVQWRHMATEILINFYSGNGLLPDGTKSCWFIREVLWHSRSQRDQDDIRYNVFKNHTLKNTTISPRDQPECTPFAMLWICLCIFLFI